MKIIDSIGQEVKIGDIIVAVNNKNPSLERYKIIGFKDGKFGKKNLPVIKIWTKEEVLLYSKYIKIYEQK